MNRTTIVICLVSLLTILSSWSTSAETTGEKAPAKELFTSADNCQACHNRLADGDGEDLSIGVQWRGSVMAHAAKDPYWRASVRRETMDHPAALDAIVDECTICHMPMARKAAIHAGVKNAIRRMLPGNQRTLLPGGDRAIEGVSCTVCHQIADEGLGEERSFTGGFVVDPITREGERAIFGPFDPEKGTPRLMSSASKFVPTRGDHIRSAQLCATCHTLYTHAVRTDGTQSERFPEQVPYLEWLHSDHNTSSSCQGCHMPAINGEAAVTSVLGTPRNDIRRHFFRGGNVFLLGMLSRFSAQLGVQAGAGEIATVRSASRQNLENAAAVLDAGATLLEKDGRTMVELRVTVFNLAGHKLPTAYPSRRVWLHVTASIRGKTVFESGALQPDGSIRGNDNDADGSAYEPHYEQIRSADEVQIWESILGDREGRVTTGLLQAERYLKDNRIPPSGFDKQIVDSDVAVIGAAFADEDFAGGEDTVVYLLDAPPQGDVLQFKVELFYQSIGRRWAQNLSDYDDADEPAAFVDMFNAMPTALSATVLSSAAVRLTP